MVLGCVSLYVLSRLCTKVRILTAFCLVIMLITVSVEPAARAVEIDGRFDPTEGYTTGFDVSFQVEDVPGSHGGAQLWVYQDPFTDDLSLAFIFPKTLVDNSYGVNAIGWGSAAPSGKEHKFKDLVGSDDLQLVLLTPSDDTLLDVTVDYLHGYGNKKEDPPFTSGGVTDGEGLVSFGNASDVLEAESSMGLNYAMYGTSHPLLFEKDGKKEPNSPEADANYQVTDPALADWQFDVTYELKVKGSVFENSPFDATAPDAYSVPLAHVSPNKIGRNKVYPTVEAVVPEPASLVVWSLLAGIAVAVMWRRKKHAAR